MDRLSNRSGAWAAPGRGFPQGAHVLLCLMQANSLGCDAVVGRRIETAVEQQRSGGHTEWLDDEYRIAHHGPENMPRSGTEWTIHESPASRGEAAVVHREAGLTIKAFAVKHGCRRKKAEMAF